MPDTIPENTSTTASMGVNDTFTGTLETLGDRDWVRVELTAGNYVQINLDGIGTNAVFDPYLYLLDGSGDVVAENDDNDGQNSQLTYTITQTGTYYIKAAGYDDVNDGDYRITTEYVAAPPPPAPTPPQGPLESLAWGSVLADTTTVNVYFAPDGETFDGYTSEGFNAYERAQIIEMMDHLSQAVDLDFNVVSDASQADLTLVLDLDEISDEADPFLGYFNPPGESGAGIGIFNGAMWDRSAGGDLEQGGFGYVTVVHELLHGLGMAHPHDDGGTSDIMEGVSTEFDDFGDYDLNQGVFTVMTYNSGYFTGTDGSAPEDASGGTYGFEGGAMALDIAYLQLLYGENTTYANGGNTYVLDRENESGTYWEAIWDTGGVDTIRHNGSDQATINLRAATLEYEVGGGGFVSAVDGVAGGYTIANGVVIENAVGGFGDDTITGNSAANTLNGRGGDDEINGRNGADEITGRRGDDVLNGGKGHDEIVGGNGHDNMNGGNGHDTLNGGKGADDISGDRGFDTLIGGRGNDDLNGGRGDDVLIGGEGRDVLTGGAGSDVFVFSWASQSRDNKVDTISDFKRGHEIIDVSGIDAKQSKDGNQTFDFIGTSDFSKAGQIRFERDDGDVIVQADMNGDGRADFELIIEDISGLSDSNFVL